MPDVEAWLLPAQAATKLGVTPLRVRQLLSERRLTHVRTSLGRLLDPADVERLRAERQQARERGKVPP